MKFKNVFWGIILLTIGVVFALRNFDIISFNWRAILDLWPLLLVLWGISVLPARPVLKLILALAVSGAAIALLYHYPGKHSDRFWFQWDDDYTYSDRDDWIPSDQVFMEPFDESVGEVTLKFDAAAGNFHITDTSSQLISFLSKGNVGPFVMTSYDNEEGRNIKITLEGVKIRKGKVRNDVEIRLNPFPVWNFEIQSGAARMDLDLSGFKVKQLSLEGGASSVDLKLGSLSDTVRVDLEMGASRTKILIPEGVGCEVRSESVLSSRRFSGFERVKSGYWQTPGFADAEKKIFIDLEAAVSDFSVERY